MAWGGGLGYITCCCAFKNLSSDVEMVAGGRACKERRGTESPRAGTQGLQDRSWTVNSRFGGLSASSRLGWGIVFTLFYATSSIDHSARLVLDASFNRQHSRLRNVAHSGPSDLVADSPLPTVPLGTNFALATTKVTTHYDTHCRSVHLRPVSIHAISLGNESKRTWCV